MTVLKQVLLPICQILARPLNDAEKVFIQNSIDTIYNDFKTRVAEGRKMPITFIDSVAQGRVWTGKRALILVW